MIVQFLEALVETVDGKKESFRIRNVDRHRNTQRPACFPHAIEAFVIYFHEWPRRDVLAQVESQRFENLQSACARLVGPDNLIRLKLAVSRLIGDRKSTRLNSS